MILNDEIEIKGVVLMQNIGKKVCCEQWYLLHLEIARFLCSKHNSPTSVRLRAITVSSD